MNKVSFRMSCKIDDDGVSHAKVKHKGDFEEIFVQILTWVVRVCILRLNLNEKEFASKIKTTYKIVKENIENEQRISE
jgi:hypothetical protein